jgi:hypothetical protein
MQSISRHLMATFAVISIVACSSGSSHESVADGGAACVPGTERCPCYPNNTCNAGLTCASLLCVNLGGISTGGVSTVGGSTGAGGTISGGSSGTGTLGGAGAGGSTATSRTGGMPAGGSTGAGGTISGGSSGTGTLGGAGAGGSTATSRTGGMPAGGSTGAGGTISGGSSGTGTLGGAGAGGATGGTGGDSGGPVILSLSTNVTTMVPSDSLIVTVVVTHPGGIAQVVGGTLSDPPAGGTYGAFGVSTIGGAYSLTLSLAQIAAVRSTTTPPGGADRTFRAQFYDQAGHSTTKDFTIHLGCPNADWALCSQKCTDFTALATCGACDHDCTELMDDSSLVTTTPTCSMGKCQKLEWLNPNTPATCEDECAKHNLSCGSAQVRFGPCDPEAITCSTLPAASGTCGVYSYSRCFCQER